MARRLRAGGKRVALACAAAHAQNGGRRDSGGVAQQHQRSTLALLIWGERRSPFIFGGRQALASRRRYKENWKGGKVLISGSGEGCGNRRNVEDKRFFGRNALRRTIDASLWCGVWRRLYASYARAAGAARRRVRRRRFCCGSAKIKRYAPGEQEERGR